MFYPEEYSMCTCKKCILLLLCGMFSVCLLGCNLSVVLFSFCLSLLVFIVSIIESRVLKSPITVELSNFSLYLCQYSFVYFWDLMFDLHVFILLYLLGLLTLLLYIMFFLSLVTVFDLMSFFILSLSTYAYP